MNINKPRRTPEKRNKVNDKRYNTGRWRRLRAYVLDRAKHLCQCDSCKELPLPSIATVADHIKQVTRGGSFWDIDNLQALNESCHQKKSARERRS
jgi:5-methylcytosine-specific restriction endonuclease McrA